MNHREPTSASTGVGQALPCLALLLLPLLTVDRAWSRPVIPYEPPSPAPTPYLTNVGSPALRFLEATPPPDLVTRPPAAAPPRPTDANATPKPDVIPFVAPETRTPAPVAADAAPATPNADQPSAPTPLPILPDDLRPRVRAEDFLPYFELPAAKPGDPTLIVPVPRAPAAPASLPPSSATYTQTPQ